MSDLLFVNCCARPRGVSRTIDLCDTFIDTKNYDVTEIKIFDEDIHGYSPEEINRRAQLIADHKYDDGMFCYARQFSQAENILIGAPLWDLSFPAKMKEYIELICVNGINFRYTDKGAVGIAKFKTLTYITTSGGYIGKPDFGSEYIGAIATFLGNGKYKVYCAQGLDIKGNDVAKIMLDAEKKIKEGC